MGTTFLTNLMDGSTANIPNLTFDNKGNVGATYDTVLNATLLGLGDQPPVGYCNTVVFVYISGPPAAADYTVVDMSPYADPYFAQGTQKKAYVLASAGSVLDGGECDSQLRLFGSTAGSGTVKLTGWQGNKLQFTVSQVQATGISDSNCAFLPLPSLFTCNSPCTCNGQGTIQVDVQGGEVDCLATE
jgi:hypothetical protein